MFRKNRISWVTFILRLVQSGWCIRDTQNYPSDRQGNWHFADVSGKIVLMCLSKPKANTLNICCDVFVRKWNLNLIHSLTLTGEWSLAIVQYKWSSFQLVFTLSLTCRMYTTYYIFLIFSILHRIPPTQNVNVHNTVHCVRSSFYLWLCEWNT